MKNIIFSFFMLSSFLFSINGIATPLSEEAIQNRVNALFERGDHADTPERRQRLIRWIGTEEVNNLRLQFLEREWANNNFPLFSSSEDVESLCIENKKRIVFYLSTTQPGVISALAWKEEMKKVMRLPINLEKDKFYLRNNWGQTIDFPFHENNWLNGFINDLNQYLDFSVQQYNR